MRRLFFSILFFFMVCCDLCAQITRYGDYSGNQGSLYGSNSFYGYYAGHLNSTSASSNTYIGAHSGRNGGNGDHNSFLGFRSGNNGASGSYNSFFGSSSGSSAGSGSRNSYIGARSGVYNSNGSNNSFLGYDAGYFSSGSNNVFLGYQAGYSDGGSSNVFIGYQAGYNETNSNKLYIDNSSTSSPLIWGDFGSNQIKINGTFQTSGNVGIGMNPSSSYRLDVNGDIRANNGWIRSTGDYGLYNNSDGTYFYSDDGNYWRMRSGRGIKIASKDNTKIMGYVYHDNVNGFGLLDGDGNWSVRLLRDNLTSFHINNSEKMRIINNGSVGIGTTSPSYKLHAAGDIYADGGWLRVSGQRGIYFQSYGGGFYMSDATWIRTYNNKSFYHNSGTMRTDGTFQVGPSGDRFVVNSSGNIGVGVTNPAEKLHVNGAIRGNAQGGSLSISSAHGYVDVGPRNTDWSHFSTDRPRFYFNKGITVDEGLIGSYNEDLQLQASGVTALTVSDTDKGVTVHNSLNISGAVNFNKSLILQDNTQDDLLVMRGNGTLASRSVQSIESPWLFTEILVGQDTMLAICPDEEVIGQVFVDVIDLNGNLRFGDNAYIDDDLDYGDNGDNDDIPDDWMKFSDRIEFKSSADNYGLVLLDKTDYLKFLNMYHDDGTSSFANNGDANSYFLRSTGRDVTFGGEVTIPSLITSDYSGNESLSFTIDANGDSDESTAPESFVFGTNDPANFKELLRIEEDGMISIPETGALGLSLAEKATETVDVGAGTIRVRALQSTDTLDQLIVADPSGRFLTRNTNTLNLSPWTVETSHVSYENKVLIGNNAEVPSATLDVAGDFRVRNIPSTASLDELVMTDSEGRIHKRDINTLELSPWVRNGTNIRFDEGKIGVGEENMFPDVLAHIGTTLKVGLNVTSDYASGFGYGVLSTVKNPTTKAFAALDFSTGEDVFRVYGNGKVEAKELLLAPDIWHDDVFEEDYSLQSLEEVENYVKENKHLPDVPSEQEVLTNGVLVGEMEGILLKKIEELTLHLIAQDKRIKELEEMVKNK